MSGHPAAPTYGVGDVVAYRDRQGRPQTGEVMGIEATWRSWTGREPLIVYTLRHPTYRNNTFYTTDRDIFGLSVGARAALGGSYHG